jgi:hypothetical protein
VAERARAVADQMLPRYRQDEHSKP